MEKLDNIPPWFDSKENFFYGNTESQSYVIEGPVGIGKEIFTIDIAKSFLCSKTKKLSSCNQCVSCNLFNEDSHPDFYIVSPEKDKKLISINQIRELQDPLYESSFLGHNKVILILPAEKMTREASDALLKSLEEPPNNTFFLLLTNKYHSLTLTVKSRCSQVSLQKPNKKEVKTWLQNNIKNNSKIDLLISLSKGKPLVALDMAKKEINKLRKTFIKEISVLIKNGKELLDLSESWNKNPDEILLKLEWMSDLIMDCLRHKYFKKSAQTYEDTNSISTYLAKNIKSDELFYLLQETNYCWSLLDSNSSLRTDYLLRALLVDWIMKIDLAR